MGYAWVWNYSRPFKGPVCRIYGYLLAKIEYDPHNYVFNSVSLLDTKNRVLVTLEWDFYIYVGSRSSSRESTMLHFHVSLLTQNRQTKHWLYRDDLSCV